MAVASRTTCLEHGVGRLELVAVGEGASLDEQSLASLRDGFRQLASNPQVRRIVLGGSAGRFLSGVDVGFFVECLASGQIDRVLALTRVAQNVLRAIAQSPKPVVAWVDGPAIGGGLELALACHRIVAGAKAKFCLPETGLGIFPGMGGTQRLPRKIGVGLAKWMIYTGSMVTVDHAAQFGLVDAVATSATCVEEALAALDTQQPRAALEPRFRDLAQLFSQRSVKELLNPALPAPTDAPSIRALVQVRSAAPQALRAAELAIDRGIALPLDDGLEEEFGQLPEVLASSDALTGLRAVGKVRPKFTGR